MVRADDISINLRPLGNRNRASAGLGEHYTRQLAERGLNVLIVARREQWLPPSVEIKLTLNGTTIG